MKKVLLAAALIGSTSLPALAVSHEFVQNNTNYALQDLQEWQEGSYTIPPYPQQPDWVGFYVPLKDNFKFYVDAKTLSIGSDGVIRFILRAVSASGAENISYEGFQCPNRSMRTYAFGDAVDKMWIESTRAVWNRMNRDDQVRMRLAEDLCPDWNPPVDADMAIKRIKKSPWL